LLISQFKLLQNSEVKLIIQGEGQLNILNNLFYLDPSEVIVNGISKPSCNKSCEFNKGLNNVTIKFNVPIESCANMFDWRHDIIEIDLSNFDASKVTNMYRMFSDCINVEKIILGNINTSLVQNMEELFNACRKLTYIDNLNFDVSSVKTMRGMFRYCESLLTINAEFNPQNVEDMYDLFARCSKMISIKLPNFKTTRATTTQGMFYQDYELRFVDLSNFEVPSITTIRSTFRYCSKIMFINLNSLKIKSNTGIWGLFDSTLAGLKICVKDQTTINVLNQYRSKIDCDNICFQENIKID
jgi:surface protein